MPTNEEFFIRIQGLVIVSYQRKFIFKVRFEKTTRRYRF